MSDPTTNALADLARAIGIRPRLTKEERAARRAARQNRAEDGTITARAARNRSLGIPQPVAGTRILVRCVPTAKNRRRCGIDFGPTEPQAFTVSSYSRAKCEELRATGDAVVSEDEAEQLLADTMLIAMPISAVAPDLAAREAEIAAREADLAAREAKAKSADEAKGKVTKKDEPKG